LKTCLSVLAFALLAVACARKAPPAAPPAVAPAVAAAPAPAEDTALPPGIAWFTGGVEAALAESAKTGRPVFLYWGAVWCPPCHQLKATVFSRSDFQQKSRLFIPVYLDGDEPGAQKWAETFGISGYPSVLILNADRGEILRIAGGMDLAQYATVLDAALEDRRPVHDVLAALAKPGARGSADDCRRIAWQAWGLEDASATASRARGRQLVAAGRACARSPADERTRLAILAAANLARAAAAKEGALPKPLAAQVGAELADEAAAARQLDALRELNASYFLALRDVDAAGAATQLGHYTAAMIAAAGAQGFARADQLGAITSALLASKALAPDGRPDVRLAALARARIARELAAQDAPYVRSGIVTGAIEVLDALDDHDQAYAIARREIDTATSPHYFMSAVADECESLGRKAEALQWHERAYREARGAATRFQWGSYWLIALMRLTPDDTGRVQEAGLTVLAELDAPDTIYRRSRIRLERIDTALRDWTQAQPAREPVAAALRTRMRSICDRLPTGDAALAACRAFAAA
jgi:thiol-disulfide isomerase/thioredoxin